MANYVVLDLEMCKVPSRARTVEYHWASEIIQIGAVKLNDSFEVTEEFSTYVTPRLGILTPDITKLTGITQEDLMGAPDIEEALRLFCAWLPEEPVLVTWSDSDSYQIRYEIQGKNLTGFDLLEHEWVDCQKIFGEKLGTDYSYGLVNALNLSDICYRDDIHNGLTDAYNTALLFGKLKLDPDFKLNSYYSSLDDDVSEEEHLGTSLGNLLSGFSLDS